MKDKSGFYLREWLIVFLGCICGFSALAEVSAAPGDLDFSLGVQGRRLITIENSNQQNGDNNSAEDIVIQPDGKILIAGYALDSFNGDSFTVVRFNTDGSLDSGFANGGVFRYEFGVGDDTLHGIVLQPDGKIVAAGEVRLNPFGSNANTAFAVIRLNANGTFDSTFDGDGIVITDITTSLDQATEVALQPDGKIIATGWVAQGGVNNGLSYDFALVRYNPNGTLDASFGSGGFAFTDFNGRGDLAQGSVLQPDGKIVLTGWSSTSAAGFYDIGLARYNTNGTLDTSFGVGGRVVTTVGANLQELVRGISLAPGGKLIVTGDVDDVFNQNADSDVFAVRYNADGSLDTSFDGDGRFVYNSNLGDREEGGQDVFAQPDGKVLIIGASHLRTESVPGGSASHKDMLLIRLNVNGSFDNSFGSGGIRLTDFGIFNPPPFGTGRTGDEGQTLALQPDGKIVAAGNAKGVDDNNALLGSFNDRLIVARFQNDLTSNTLRRPAFDFDGDGKADISVYRPSEGIWYLLQSTGGFSAERWGTSTDKIMPADYDGDGRTDLAIFRRGENSTWYIINSATNTIRTAQWGATNLEQQLLLFDTPVPSDYDGDGKADLAVWRLTDNLGEPARFLIQQSSNNEARAAQWGNNSDLPAAADYDGDGKSDLAVFRSGTWYILQSTDNATRVTQFGLSQDKIVAADYDGDRKADLAVYRGGTWYILQSTQGFKAFQFGLSGDLPVAADYDGDGRADIAVFRDGVWHLQRTTSGYTALQFGLGGDRPIPSAFVP